MKRGGCKDDGRNRSHYPVEGVERTKLFVTLQSLGFLGQKKRGCTLKKIGEKIVKKC